MNCCYGELLLLLFFKTPIKYSHGQTGINTIYFKAFFFKITALQSINSGWEAHFIHCYTSATLQMP